MEQRLQALLRDRFPGTRWFTIPNDGTESERYIGRARFTPRPDPSATGDVLPPAPPRPHRYKLVRVGKK